MKYYIFRFNLGKLKSLVKKLAKKTEVKFDYDENDIKQERILVANGVYAICTKIGVELDINYKVGDYDIIAELEHHTEGNIIRAINPKYSVPTQYRTCKPYCEHCNKLRNRANTYLLIDANNNYKQVGKSCLKDFIGYDSTKVISMIDSINSLIRDYNEEEIINESNYCKYRELKELANKFYQILLKDGYTKDKNDPFFELENYKYNKDLEPMVDELLNVINPW